MKTASARRSARRGDSRAGGGVRPQRVEGRARARAAPEVGTRRGRPSVAAGPRLRRHLQREGGEQRVRQRDRQDAEASRARERIHARLRKHPWGLRRHSADPDGDRAVPHRRRRAQRACLLASPGARQHVAEEARDRLRRHEAGASGDPRISLGVRGNGLDQGPRADSWGRRRDPRRSVPPRRDCFGRVERRRRSAGARRSPARSTSGCSSLLRAIFTGSGSLCRSRSSRVPRRTGRSPRRSCSRRRTSAARPSSTRAM